jgi:hypothetical protein
MHAERRGAKGAPQAERAERGEGPPNLVKSAFAPSGASADNLRLACQPQLTRSFASVSDLAYQPYLTRPFASVSDLACQP